jgi:RNA polymerase sigma factor (TIGR02999 family)
MNDVTQILNDIEHGDVHAAERLLPLVYEELRRLATDRLRGEKAGLTLQATALVHEAYLRLVGEQQFNSRGHFFGAAAEAMRRILVESARRKETLKRGGERDRADIDLAEFAALERPAELLAVDEALAGLAATDPLAAEVVKLRYFADLPMVETAAALNISVRTAERHWTYARAWLRRTIEAA